MGREGEVAARLVAKLLHSKTRCPSSYPNCRPCCCGLRRGSRHVIARARSPSGNSDPRGVIISLHFISEFTLGPRSPRTARRRASSRRLAFAHCRISGSDRLNGLSERPSRLLGERVQEGKKKISDSDATRQTGSHIPRVPCRRRDC